MKDSEREAGCVDDQAYSAIVVGSSCATRQAYFEDLTYVSLLLRTYEA